MILKLVIKNNLKLLFKKPKILFYKCLAVAETFFGIRRDYHIRIWKNKFIIPNYIDSVGAIEEMYVDDFYDTLKWCKTLIDIWWYLGESGVFFANNNEEVIIYEIDKANFKYITKNISYKKNIQIHNLAVVWDDKKKTVTFATNHEHSMMGGIEQNNKIFNPSSRYEVSSAYIWDIIKKYNPDGIKIDIEWWEYEIVDEMMRLDIFPFQKGLIEYHIRPVEKDKLISKFENFVKFLDNKWYRHKTIDAFRKNEIWNDSLINKIKLKNITVFFIIFEK